MVGLQILNGDLATGIGASSWVGGFPYIFPFLSSMFYTVGGIVGSRFFMVLLGTASVFLIYIWTKQLMFFKDERSNKKAGLVAAAFMAITTIAITTSRLAIYDGLAFMLFLLGIVLYHKAIYSGERKFYIISAIVLFLSFLAKYIVAIYFPFILLIPVILAIKLHHREFLRGIFLSFCLPFLLLMGLYIGLNFSNMQEFFVNQGVIQKASFWEVLSLFWQYTGTAYVLCILSLPLLLKTRRLLVIMLVFFSIIPLIIHSMSGNTSSVQQHTFLALLFSVPIAGAGFVALMQKKRKIALSFVSLVFFFQLILTQGQVQEAEGFWPNVTDASRAMKENMSPSDRVLAESGDSIYLELKDNIPSEQLTGPFVFSYAGKDGLPAYVEAIKNGYFQFVQLDGTFFSEDDLKVIEQSLQGNYRKTYERGSLKVYEIQNE